MAITRNSSAAQPDDPPPAGTRSARKKPAVPASAAKRVPSGGLCAGEGGGESGGGGDATSARARRQISSTRLRGEIRDADERLGMPDRRASPSATPQPRSVSPEAPPSAVRQRPQRERKTTTTSAAEAGYAGAADAADAADAAAAAAARSTTLLARLLCTIGLTGRKGLSVSQLRHASPIRRDLNFAHPLNDYDNDHYEYHFGRLWLQIYTFAQDFFGRPGFVKRESWSWYHDISAEFCQLTEMVAIGDPSRPGWRDLINSREQRQLLVQAVMAKVLCLYVFDKLLFGASPMQEDYLRDQDHSQRYLEGYSRAGSRSRLIRAMLSETAGEPARFWDCVDKLGLQTTALLIPLINTVTAAQRDPGRGPTAAGLHQRVHDIVAYAAWLSVCVRYSPVIFRFDWPTPADLYESNQVNVAPQVFDWSRSENGRLERWMMGRGIPASQRMARVKIAVIPQVRRFQPIYPGQGQVRTSGKQQIWSVTQSHAAYYYGLADDGADRAARPARLAEVRQSQRRFHMATVSCIVLAVLLGLLCLLLSVAWILGGRPSPESSRSSTSWSASREALRSSRVATSILQVVSGQLAGWARAVMSAVADLMSQ